jgi:Flp pilus assembly protein TadD
VAGYSVTRQARVCAACGAKNRPDWRKCQRCHAPLAIAPSNAEAKAAASARRAGSVVPIAAFLAIVAIAGFLLMRGASARPFTSQRDSSTIPTGTTRSSPRDRTSDNRRAAAPAPVTAGDFARAGAGSFRKADFGSALAQFEAAVAARPDDPDAVNNLGQTLVRLNRAPEAIPRFESAVRLAPGKWAYRFNLARARGLSGDWNGAAEDYRVADRLFPDDHATLFNLALALRKAGRTAEALPILERVIALAPEDPSFVLTTARTYDELDRREEAVASYRKFLSQSPAGAEADAARGRLAALEGEGAQ